MINHVPAAILGHNVYCYSTVAHILTPSVNLAFGPQLGFKNKYRAPAGFGLVISVSGRVQALKCGPFTTLCGYVCMGQQGERVKSFCEVGYARQNVFGAGKRISTEILVGVGLHA